MDDTRKIVEWITTLDLEEVPADVRRYAALLVLDQLGCQVAGTNLPWSQQVVAAIAPLAAYGPSTVACSDHKLAPDAAAFLNSSLGHSNESDDTHLKSPNHPGAVVIPAAIAVAEEMGSSGADLLRAIIAGYEVMLRISCAASPHLIAQGHHPPPAVGPFGAAAAASLLYGLSAEETLHALGIAGSHSAGLLEYTQSGGSVKRMHCAIPAQAGVRSAILARHGVTAPPTILEGERGFLKVFAQQYDRSWLTRDLGQRYLLLETSIKSYSCCYLIHPAIDAYRDLQQETSFDVSDIVQMTVFTQSEAVRQHVGVITEPSDILGAQFSSSFALSLLAHSGSCGFWDFFEADLDDPDLLALARRIDTVVEQARDDTFATGVRLVVQLTNGSTLERSVAHASGEPENPLSEQEIIAKFLSMATPGIGAERSSRLVTELLNDAHELPSAQDLMSLLASAGHVEPGQSVR